jgi:hypothetical protein
VIRGFLTETRRREKREEKRREEKRRREKGNTISHFAFAQCGRVKDLVSVFSVSP